jgi:pyochelin biosynthetic protein PchC
MSTEPTSPADGRLLRWHHHGRDHLLVCLHHAGGGAANYAAWPRQLADCADLAIVQLPGREDRLEEQLQESLPELAHRLAAALAGTAHKHFVLLGHSMGATIAWWVAAELWNAHGLRAAVAVSSRAPLAQVPAAWNPESSLEGWFRLMGEAPPQALVVPELRQLLRQTLDMDMAWMQREFNRTLPGPLPLDLSCLCAQEDQLATCEQMSDWRRFSTGTFRIYRLPGGHLHLLNRPQAVLRVVRELLKGARPACSTN